MVETKQQFMTAILISSEHLLGKEDVVIICFVETAAIFKICLLMFIFFQWKAEQSEIKSFHLQVKTCPKDAT